MLVSTTKIYLNFAAAIAVVFMITGLSSAAMADEITDWNRIAQQALLNAASSPVVSTRSLAIVQVSVFDAVNGIERRYEPIHADMDAPRGASRRAAAVQAAYASLLHLLPAQLVFLDAQRTASLNAIASGRAAETSESIARGIEWGQAVADDVYSWRLTDGSTPAPPPFMGGLGIGEWRPTPPGLLPGALPQYGHLIPWAIAAPEQSTHIFLNSSTSSHSFCRGLQICSFPYFVCRTLHYAVALLKRSYNANEIPFARTFLDIHPLGKAVLVADNKGALGE